MKTFIGIDPGANGGIAAISTRDGRLVAVAQKMPETPRDLWEAMRVFSAADCFALLENVHAHPKQGVCSVFTFGNGMGMLRMALVAAGIPYEEVSPAKWQRALGCLTKGDKNTSKRKAQELFPAIAVTHAIADALLIAEYGRRTHSRKEA